MTIGHRVQLFFFTFTHFQTRTLFLCQVRSGGPAICDDTHHVTAIIGVDGVTICDETQHVTAIIDVDGAPVVEPTQSSASGHLQSKLRTCPYCRLQFTTDRHLCDHIRTQHADMRYSCQQCPCTFVSTCGLNRHVRNIHQKLVKFRCQTCGKGYEGRRNYHDHMATHAGVKRNVCMICQAQFTFKRGLKVHVLRFHPDAIESLSHS